MNRLPSLLLLLVLGGSSAAAWARDPAASRLLSPSTPGVECLRTAWARGGLDRSAGSLFPRDATGVLPGGDGWARAARPWLPGGVAARGLRLAVDARVLGFAADPPRQLQPLFADLRADGTVDPAWRLRAGVWADAGLAPGWSAHLRFVLDTDGTNDPTNRTRDFGQLGASNNLDEAYLRYRAGAADVVLGRRFLLWGPDGLLLSTTAPAMDMLYAAFDLGPHRVQAFVGRLSGVDGLSTLDLAEPLPDGTSSLGTEVELHRSVYGHRLDLSLGSGARLGLSEVALLARTAGGLDLKYLNPVSIHAVTQTEEDGGDSDEVNVVHQIDGEIWLGVWHLHGALLVDDLQIDSAPRETWPDQTAWAVGADLALEPLPEGLLSYDYRRIGSWTYLHRGDGLDWQHYGRPLGAEEGPDMDRHRLLLRCRPHAEWALWAGLERRRRGENRLDTTESREGHAGESYPRGRVERRWVAGLGARWQRAPWLRVGLDLAWHAIRNVGNGEKDETILELRGGLELYGPALSWLLP